MNDFLIAGWIFLVVGSAAAYIIKEKKRGVACIGCPSGGACSRKHGEHSECGCGCHHDHKE